MLKKYNFSFRIFFFAGRIHKLNYKIAFQVATSNKLLAVTAVVIVALTLCLPQIK